MRDYNLLRFCVSGCVMAIEKCRGWAEEDWAEVLDGRAWMGGLEESLEMSEIMALQFAISQVWRLSTDERNCYDVWTYHNFVLDVKRLWVLCSSSHCDL
jgi:hypothetical protein